MNNLYECEKCGSIFKTYDEGYICEKSHFVVDDFEAIESTYENGGRFPNKIFVWVKKLDYVTAETEKILLSYTFNNEEPIVEKKVKEQKEKAAKEQVIRDAENESKKQDAIMQMSEKDSEFDTVEEQKKWYWTVLDDYKEMFGVYYGG